MVQKQKILGWINPLTPSVIMLDKNRITDVFFDLDPTLWDFEKNSALTFEKIFKQLNVDLQLGDFLHVYDAINHHY